jgi:hypothetical protein
MYKKISRRFSQILPQINAEILFWKLLFATIATIASVDTIAAIITTLPTHNTPSRLLVTIYPG